MDKFKKLMGKCKCSITLTVNDHRDYYDSIEVAIVNAMTQEVAPDHTDEILEGIRRTGTLINLHFYPHTPCGFYEIMDYDIDRIMDKALSMVEE